MREGEDDVGTDVVHQKRNNDKYYASFFFYFFIYINKNIDINLVSQKSQLVYLLLL